MKYIKISLLVLFILFGVRYSASFVNAQTAAPTVTLTASPQNFSGYQGLSTNITLSWTSTGANDWYCTGGPVPNGAGSIHLFPLDQNWSTTRGPNSDSSSFLFANSTGPADMTFSMNCGSYSTGTNANPSVVVKYTPLSNPVVVTLPNAGDSLQIGSAQTITWTFPDVFSSDATSVAKISALDKDGKSYLIAPINGISNTGSFAWKAGDAFVASGSSSTSMTWVPTTMPANGSPYRLSIGVSGTHTGTVTPGYVYFNLADSGSSTSGGSSATPTITITSPAANSTWALGSSQTIRWSNTRLPSAAKGRIVLNGVGSGNRDPLKTFIIANNVSNTGSYVWNSVGSAFGRDPGSLYATPGAYPPYSACNYASDAPWSCYTTLTTIPTGQYNMSVMFSFDPKDVFPVNNLGQFIVDGKPSNLIGLMTVQSLDALLNIGASGTVSTPPTPPNSTPSLPPAECLGGPSATNNCPPVTTHLGCSGGNIFNTQTGLLCNAPLTPALGCSGGNIYNTQTGLLCNNNNQTNPSSQSSGSSSYDFGTATLKVGSKGDAVMELQKFLNAKLSLNLVEDGSFGLKTKTAVMNWQSNEGLYADGLFGAKSKKKAIEN